MSKQRLVSAAVQIPHPDKAYKGGEDAFIISEDGMMVAVADGVGGWNDVGVDPALFSKELCHHVANLHS